MASETTALAAAPDFSEAAEESPALKLTEVGRKVLAEVGSAAQNAAAAAERRSGGDAANSSHRGKAPSGGLSVGKDATQKPVDQEAGPASFTVADLPVMCGYLYKKSPQRLRITAWDQRFFVVVNMKMFWWRDRQSCALDITGRERATTAEIESQSLEMKPLPQYKGMINFAISEPKIVAMWSEKTKFRLLAPAKGWRTGATTDKRNDTGRDYEFDVDGSSHSRSEWVELIRKHIEQAQLYMDDSDSSTASGSSTVGSEYWEDVTVDERSQTMSRFFGKKAQANKENREQNLQQQQQQELR